MTDQNLPAPTPKLDLDAQIDAAAQASSPTGKQFLFDFRRRVSQGEYISPEEVGKAISTLRAGRFSAIEAAKAKPKRGSTKRAAQPMSLAELALLK